MRPILVCFAACLTIASAAAAQRAVTSTTAEWRAYGRDAANTRYSPLAGIDRGNVSRLAVAWTYLTGEIDTTRFHFRREPRFEATPIMVDGTLYLSTPFGRVIALDPATGRERWTFDAKPDVGGQWGDFANRVVSTWVDPAAAPNDPCRRIFLGAVDGRIVALDARTGKPCAGFGDHGSVSLRRGLRNTPSYREEYELTSPPAIVRGLIVTGSAVADNNRVNAASGEVRAFDARTGALRWSWDPIPRDSADPAWSSWRGPMAHITRTANAWSVIAADSARDLVFVPTGSASPDYFGGERIGDNRYANSVVALRASTGRVVWHFQAVHHDLWDYDVASPPTLATITHDGHAVDVVLQATKTGQAHPARSFRHRRSDDEQRPTRRSVHANARDAVRHAPAPPLRAQSAAVHEAALRLARRRRSALGTEALGRAAWGHDRARGRRRHPVRGGGSCGRRRCQPERARRR